MALDRNGGYVWEGLSPRRSCSVLCVQMIKKRRTSLFPGKNPAKQKLLTYETIMTFKTHAFKAEPTYY